MAMRFKDGISASQAMQNLEWSWNQLANQRSGGRANAIQVYVRWVGDAERQVRGIFIEPDVAGDLQSLRYQELVRHVNDDPFLGPITTLLFQEIEDQYARLTAVKEQLDALQSLAGVPGKVVVYDTNSLMHYHGPSQVKWAEVFGDSVAVRLVVPLCVIGELDQKVHTGSERMADRAQQANKALREILNGVAPGEAVAVKQSGDGNVEVTLEVLGEELGHARLPEVDDEVIDRAKLLAGITGRAATVLTHDYNMQLRAQARGVATTQLAGKYRKTQTPVGGC